jgi:hypothetical protein
VAADRLMGSYVVRVVVRDGVRWIVLHDFATAETARFADFAALAEHLERSTRRGDGAPARPDPPRAD